MDFLAIWLLLTICAFLGAYIYYIRAILMLRVSLLRAPLQLGRLIEKK